MSTSSADELLRLSEFIDTIHVNNFLTSTSSSSSFSSSSNPKQTCATRLLPLLNSLLTTRSAPSSSTTTAGMISLTSYANIIILLTYLATHIFPPEFTPPTSSDNEKTKLIDFHLRGGSLFGYRALPQTVRKRVHSQAFVPVPSSQWSEAESELLAIFTRSLLTFLNHVDFGPVGGMSDRFLPVVLLGLISSSSSSSSSSTSTSTSTSIVDYFYNNENLPLYNNSLPEVLSEYFSPRR